MAENIGTAELRLVVNIDSMQAAFEKGKALVSGFGDAAQAELAKADKASVKQANSLNRQIAKLSALGPAASQARASLLALDIGAKSSGAVQAELKGKLDAVVNSLNAEAVAAAKTAAAVNASALGATKAFSGTNKSARELNFALRSVPAQFTDIATSLAGGQSPMLVLLQQGGQLKDLFGGVGAAVQAMGGYIRGLITPLNVAIAGAAALAAAFYDAEKQATDLRKSIVLTGNASGTSIERLNEIAARVDEVSSGTARNARNVLAALNATGRFTEAQLEQLTIVAIEMEKATGRSIDETVQQYTRLADRPLESILELAKGTRILTAEMADHVLRLAEQGKESEASALLIQKLAEEEKRRALQLQAEEGFISTTFTFTLNVFAETWDTVTTAITGAQEAITKFGNEYVKVDKSAFGGVGNSSVGKFLSATIPGARAEGGASASAPAADLVDPAELKRRLDEQKKAEEERGQIRARWNAEYLELATEAERRETEILNIIADGNKLRLDRAQIEDRIALKRKQFAEEDAKAAEAEARRNAAAAKRAAFDPSAGLFDRLTKQIALNKEALVAQENLTQSERLSVTAKIELEKIIGKLSEARANELRGLIEAVEATGAEAEAAKESAKAKEQLIRLTNQLSQVEAGRRQANQDYLDSFGKGDAELERARRRLEIEREYQAGVADLVQRGLDVGSEAYRQQEQALRESRDRMLADEADFQSKAAAAQANWQNGLSSSIQNYIDNASNVAAQTEQLFSSAFRGLEDVLTDFISKGTADWRGFLDSMLADITRFIIRQQLSKWLESLSGGGGGGGFGSAIANFFGSLFGGGSANGNAFIGGNQVQAFAKGGVVNGLTPFGMSGGRFGIMGEAGPEAILPLKRGNDGKLGVEVTKAAQPVRQMVNNTTFYLPERVTRETQAQIAMRTRRAIAGSSRND